MSAPIKVKSNDVATGDEESGKTLPGADKSNGDAPGSLITGLNPSNGGVHSHEATDDVKATQQQMRNLEMELKHAHEALSALKMDRKRLKAEKFDVLNQMKQLYATLEDKEKELREFIRSYEKRMRESEAALRQLIAERNEAEREKWTILRHARDEAQRCLSLTTQLAARDVKVHQLQEELSQLRGQLSQQRPPTQPLPALPQQQQQHPHLPSQRTSPIVAYAATSSASSNSHYHQVGRSGSGGGTKHHQRSSISSMDSAAIVSDPGGDEPLYSRIDHSSSTEVSQHQRAQHQHQPTTPTTNSNLDTAAVSTTIESGEVSRSNGSNKKYENVHRPQNSAEPSWKSNDHINFGSKTLGRISSKNKSSNGGAGLNNNSGGPWGSISRVFARASKQRKTLDLALFQSQGISSDHALPRESSRRSWSPRDSICTTPLSEETVADRFRFWDEAQNLAVERWKAGHVLAWLEFGLGMGRFLSACANNIKSGKVLLELTDTELEAGLGLNHAMHRKKIRLAIEERRTGNIVRYPLLSTIGNRWVINEWLTDIGLEQYADNFSLCLMDARLLDNLTKRELEKHLGVTRKAHQSSIVHGITFLRMIKYDRQAINERRRQCEFNDCDPLVWTNQRFINWVRAIDLNEYAENLKGTGIHGAVVVLDPAFTADVMATALGIPNSKNIIRRHLTSELEALVQVPRARYEQRARQARAERKRLEKLDTSSNSLSRNLSRSFTTGLVFTNNDQDEFHEGESNTFGSKSVRASLSRAFGRKIKQERFLSNSASVSGGSPPEGSDAVAGNGSTEASTFRSSVSSDARSWTLKKSSSSHSEKQHRRIKSISDIENITVTRV